VSNCHVLCKKCRYSRCIKIGLGAETPTCSICSSGSGLNELEICANCQEFLSDSVAEDSHSKMICLKASPGDCHITAENTKSFSACPGCWIKKLRSSGVIEKYLVQIGYTVKQEEEYENQETSIIDGDKCVVCDRGCTSVYREKIVCTICKKFFLKCVKSRCYKDFCCANDSTCDMKHKSRCSFCWWSKCVFEGLTNVQPSENRNKKI